MPVVALVVSECHDGFLLYGIISFLHLQGMVGCIKLWISIQNITISNSEKSS